MKSDESIQAKMYREIRQGDIFAKAHEYGLQYLQGAFDRNVYPTTQAIESLAVFDEHMPSSTSDASQIIDLLNDYGSPATVSQIGGRYFGFVCGSSVPAGLAAKSLATYWDQNAAMHVLSPIASKLEVVVLDVKMPGMDGIETLREIKLRHPLVEVIMLTGHATVETAIEGMKLGAFDYLMKPCDIDTLVAKVEAAAARKAEHDEKIVQARIKEITDRQA